MRKNLFVIGFVTVLVVFGLFLASGRVNNLLFRQGLQQTPATPSLSEENSGIQMATILVFGDSGTGGAVQKKLAELMESVSADAILHTGDLAYSSGTKQELQNNFVSIYSNDFRKKLLPTPGNHDYLTNNGAPYYEHFVLPEQALNPKDNERYYSVDINGAHIISLNTNEPLKEISDNRQDDMADWLERDLANSNPHMPVIVFFHEPAFNSGKHQPNMLVRQKLTPILDKYHVDLVISGHDHNYQRTCPMVYSVSGTQCRTDGTTYIVTGGGGANLYQINPDVPDYFEATISDYNFVKLTLSDNISIQAINIDGEVIDTAGIRYK